MHSDSQGLQRWSSSGTCFVSASTVMLWVLVLCLGDYAPAQPFVVAPVGLVSD